MIRATLLLSLFCIFSSAEAQIKCDSWANVKSSGKGTLSVIYYEQPGLIQKLDGQMKGVCVDLLREFKDHVKAKHNKDIEIIYVANEKDFSKFLKTVQMTPNLLGVTNTSITEERKKILKFTPPFMTTPLVLLTNEKAPSLKKLSDLSTTYKGFTAEVISGSTHVTHIEKIKKDYYPELNVRFTSSSESVIKNLVADPRLFSILDFPEYVDVVRKSLPIKRQEVDLGSSEALAFIMPKQSDWDAVWNEFLTPEFRRSLVYKKIIMDNLGPSFMNLIR